MRCKQQEEELKAARTEIERLQQERDSLAGVIYDLVAAEEVPSTNAGQTTKKNVEELIEHFERDSSPIAHANQTQQNK